MSPFLALFLGIVQGLTEFLPVSSSGHLIMFRRIFGVEEDMLLFDIILHIATLLAVVTVFWKKIWFLIRHPLHKTNLCLLITTAITCTFVLLFKDFIDSTFTYKILPITFMVTAIILFMTSFTPAAPYPKLNPNADIGFPNACIVGLAQGLAVIPGLSRSGTTISTLLFTGTKREQAAEFSFLMSIPIIAASFVYELTQIKGAAKIEALPTVIAFFAALVCGVIAIKFMLGIIKKVKLHYFSFYLAALAIVCLFLFRM